MVLAGIVALAMTTTTACSRSEPRKPADPPAVEATPAPVALAPGEARAEAAPPVAEAGPVPAPVRLTPAPPATPAAPVSAPASAEMTRAPAPVPPAAREPVAIPARPAPRVARLKAGQVLTVRTTRLLSTKTMKTGDPFSAILEEPIEVDGWIVAGAGARVDGRVAEADKGGRLKGKASLSIELTSLTTSAGEKTEIVTSPLSSESAVNRGKDAKKIGIGAGAGAAVGAVAGGGKGAAVGALLGGGAGAAMRGEAAEVPAETVLRFELRSPVTIREKPLQ